MNSNRNQSKFSEHTYADSNRGSRLTEPRGRKGQMYEVMAMMLISIINNNDDDDSDDDFDKNPLTYGRRVQAG